jgi:hypothetical protein
VRSLLAALLLLALLAHAAEPPATPSYPLWDGQESIEQYAKRAGVEPNKTLDLGNGVRLEMVLVPAGKFTMGTPEPESTWVGGSITLAGCCCWLCWPCLWYPPYGYTVAPGSPYVG